MSEFSGLPRVNLSLKVKGVMRFVVEGLPRTRDPTVQCNLGPKDRVPLPGLLLVFPGPWYTPVRYSNSSIKRFRLCGYQLFMYFSTSRSKSVAALRSVLVSLCGGMWVTIQILVFLLIIVHNYFYTSINLGIM